MGINMKRISALVLGVIVAGAAAISAQAPVRGGRNARQQVLAPELRDRLTHSLVRATTYLKSQQQADGGWENHPGITAMAALVSRPAAIDQHRCAGDEA